MIPSNDDFPSAQECLHTPNYCEENVWKLCEKLKNMNYSAFSDCYCVFVSNEEKVIPLWYQKGGNGDDSFILWDYHVFLVRRSQTVDVYDLDTLLGFPTPFDEYVRKAIGSEDNIIPMYHRLFRVIPAKQYIQSFASDRSHMKDEKGEYLKSPPPYDPIETSDCTNNLDKFVSMRPDDRFGKVMDLNGFIRYFNRELRLVRSPQDSLAGPRTSPVVYKGPKEMNVVNINRAVLEIIISHNTS